MTPETLPDIPRLLTATAEWAACLMYLLLLGRPFSRAVLTGGAAAALLALILVHLVAEQLPISLWIAGMLAAAGTMYTFLALMGRLPAMDSGFLLARAFVLAELIASLHWQLHVFFFPGTPADFGPWGWAGAIALGMVVYGTCFGAAAVVENRVVSQGRTPQIDVPGLLAATAIAAVTFLMSNLSFVTSHTPFSSTTESEIFYIRTLVNVAGYAALLGLHSQRQAMRRRQDVRAMRQLVRSQHDQYLQSRRNIEQVNRKYHDLKHYITAFRTETDPHSKADYLDRLEESISGYGDQVQTGNAVVDAVLAAKLGDAEDRGIELTSVVDGAALEFMEPLDLSALLGNALDNALEATAEVTDPQHRLIRFQVRRREQFLLIQLENVFSGELDYDDGLPRSTKVEPSEHGYGLPNMRQIAERYQGTLTVMTTDGWFAVVVLLPLPQA